MVRDPFLLEDNKMYYQNLKTVKETLISRKSIKKKVEAYWQEINIVSPISVENPVAFVGKPAMFRVESALCITMAETVELDIAWLTYNDDAYTDASSIKRSMVQPYFASRFDKNGQFITSRSKLVSDLQKINKMQLKNLVCTKGENIVDMHALRLNTACPNVGMYDLSENFKTLGGRATCYYDFYLSLFVAHGVLLEDYHGGESGQVLDSFTQNVFEPAFNRVTEMFGVKPLLVKLPWKPGYEVHPSGELLTNWRQMVTSKL